MKTESRIIALVMWVCFVVMFVVAGALDFEDYKQRMNDPWHQAEFIDHCSQYPTLMGCGDPDYK